jgi:lipid A 3-O-deacylase
VIKLFIKTAFPFSLFFCAGNVYPQLIDNTATFRAINHNSFFRFHYDNDYFTKTDEYYSQGVTFEYVHPSLKKNPVTKLLWKPFGTAAQYGIGLNLFAYTPTSILSDSILYGDRPYNANISLKTFSIQVDDIHQQQISTAFSLGIMGPAALGFEMQDNIHKWLKNPRPHGWQYQTKNDIIINYQLNYEKQLLQAGNNFLLNTIAEARIGTLNNKLSGGFNFMAGRFNKRFRPVTYEKRKAEFYLYAQGRVNFIGYDASMQGGLFTRNNPYVIAAGDVNRVTFQADAGVIVNFNRFYLSYTQSILTKEFNGGTYHRWGGVSAGFAL